MNKPLFNKVCIIGVGLIGGSLGRAIIRKNLARRVIAVVRRKHAVYMVREYNAADEVQRNLIKALKGADLVILATPINSIINLLRKIRPLLQPSAIVMDVGSTKEMIEQTAIAAGYRTWFTPESSGPVFVGCHPLAGSEKTGVENSSPNLFKGSTCFITDKNPKVVRLWRAFGAKTYQISADSHDNLAAHVSHLPHLLAFLMFFGWETKYPLANPSIREFLRLSKSDSDMWSQIFCSNSRSIESEIESLIKSLQIWKRAITKKNPKRVKKLILESQAIHSLPKWK